MLNVTVFTAFLVLTAAMATAQEPRASEPSQPADDLSEPADLDPDLETDPLTHRSSHEGFGTRFTEPLTSETLQGVGVYADDDQRLGTIADLSIGTDSSVENVVIEAGGIMGAGAREVTLPMDDVELVQAHDGKEVRAYVTLSPEEFEQLPDSGS